MPITGMLLTRKKVVQVKVEATAGVKETTGLTDVLVFDPVIQPTSPFDERRGTGKYLGSQWTGIVNEKIGTFACNAELRGNGTAGMEPGLAVLLQACGLKKTSEVYQVSSAPADHKTCTITVFQDGGGSAQSRKKILYGAMGNVTFEGVVGKTLMCRFDFTGIYNAPADADLPTYSPNTNLPPILASGTFTIGGVARKISRLSLNMGNVIVPRLDVNATSGLAYAVITDIDPTLTFDLEAELVVNYDIYGIWLAGTTAAVSLVLGSGAGKAITFTLPKLQYSGIPEGDRDGIMIEDITGKCLHSSGDDAVSISVATL